MNIGHVNFIPKTPKSKFLLLIRYSLRFWFNAPVCFILSGWTCFTIAKERYWNSSWRTTSNFKRSYWNLVFRRTHKGKVFQSFIRFVFSARKTFQVEWGRVISERNEKVERSIMSLMQLQAQSNAVCWLNRQCQNSDFMEMH